MAVKTTAIKAWRESEVPSGAKSDPGDADVIADYLRVRHQPLRVLAPFCDATKALRTVVRVRDDLVDQRVAAINQLAALLDAFWPDAKAIFADVESPTALSFLERYPTPASAARLGDTRMAAFCAKVRYSGGRTPAELLERLRGAPAGIADAAGTAAAGDAVLAMVTVLRALNAAIKDLERSINDTEPSPWLRRSGSRGTVAGGVLTKPVDAVVERVGRDTAGAVINSPEVRYGPSGRWTCSTSRTSRRPSPGSTSAAAARPRGCCAASPRWTHPLRRGLVHALPPAVHIDRGIPPRDPTPAGARGAGQWTSRPSVRGTAVVTGRLADAVVLLALRWWCDAARGGTAHGYGP